MSDELLYQCRFNFNFYHHFVTTNEFSLGRKIADAERSEHERLSEQRAKVVQTARRKKERAKEIEKIGISKYNKEKKKWRIQEIIEWNRKKARMDIE